MAKFVDPLSGDRKFIIGPGRTKDRNLKELDKPISDSSRVIGSDVNHTESEHKVDNKPTWQGPPPKPPKQRKSKKREFKLSKFGKNITNTNIDSVPTHATYWRADDDDTTT